MEDLHPRIINAMDEWQILKAALVKQGYKRFQTQYDATQEEGFHAWFIGNGKRVEVITHNPEIQRDIIKSDIKTKSSPSAMQLSVALGELVIGRNILKL